MKTTPLVLTILAVGLTGEAFAQPVPEPPTLKLPAGARVRLTTTERGSVVALLARHDEGSVTLVLPSENPLVPSPELLVPAGSITRMEVSLGQKRHALIGAALGAVLLGLTGFSDPVDTSDGCGDNAFGYSDQPCSRAEAVAVAVVAGAAIGGVVGHFVTTERWAPVALDALGSPVAGEGRVQPRVRASSDGLTLGVSVRF